MVEPRLAEPPQLFLVEQRAAGDQVDIEIIRARVLNQFDEILAKDGFAAREMQLHDAKFGGFRKHASPFVSREFIPRAVEVDGVGTVQASERASICKLGDERV